MGRLPAEYREREGRVTRRPATYVIPGVYENLDGDGRQNQPETSAQSYFLAVVESGFLEAFADHCEQLCSGGSGGRWRI